MSEATKGSGKPPMTVDTLKQVDESIKKQVAKFIGSGMPIGEVLTKVLDYYKSDYDFSDDISDEEAISLLRGSLRTCNPNDKKFNVNKYGASYREGRLAYVRGMGDNLLRA